MGQPSSPADGTRTAGTAGNGSRTAARIPATIGMGILGNTAIRVMGTGLAVTRITAMVVIGIDIEVGLGTIEPVTRPPPA